MTKTTHLTVESHSLTKRITVNMSLSLTAIGQFLDEQFAHGELKGNLPVGHIRRLETTLEGQETTVIIKHSPSGRFTVTISTIGGHWSIHYLQDKQLERSACQ